MPPEPFSPFVSLTFYTSSIARNKTLAMSNQTSENNKRIAKNTLLLYLRMLFMMVVSLYTSRVILNALGVDDYGIYNVVGGVVAMFSVISGSLSAAISRFITYELGKNDKDSLNKVFSASVTIQIVLSLIIVVLIEIIGVWFLNNKMTIPADRMDAANWVLQLSIVTFVINLISVPYNAAIIAHEKMSAFAYISILEAVGKLIVAYLILLSAIDKLVFYAISMCAVAAMVRLAYGHYCKKHFGECEYHFRWDKDILKQMFSFAGWNFIGFSAIILRDQGGNIILNLFFGPSVNAARAIAQKVNTVLSSFVTNFTTALNPQITKSYASGDREYMMKLIIQGTRLSFYMLLALSLPVLLNTEYLLIVWLKLIPEHTVLFVQLTLILAMHECLGYPLVTAMLATGNIKKYQIIVGGINLLNLPISYVCLMYGLSPESILVVAIIFSLLAQVARLVLLKTLIQLDVTEFMKKVYANILLITIVALCLPLFVNSIMQEGGVRFIVVSILAVLSTILTEFFVGCNKEERDFVIRKVKARIEKR